MYRAIEKFADLEDEKYIYDIGMIYPRKGYDPSEERVKELSGSENAVGKPVIEFFADPESKQEDSKPKKDKKKK